MVVSKSADAVVVRSSSWTPRPSASEQAGQASLSGSLVGGAYLPQPLKRPIERLLGPPTSTPC